MTAPATTPTRRRKRTSMATRAQQLEIERQRNEQGERFIQQMGEMFKQTRTDMELKFIPRLESDARFEHLEKAVERAAVAVAELASNVSVFQQNAPRIYSDRADAKADIAELRTAIEKLKTARESDMQRGYGARFEDMQRGYKSEAAVERGWRSNAQQQGNLALGWIIGGGIALFTTVIGAILAISLRR